MEVRIGIGEKCQYVVLETMAFYNRFLNGILAIQISVDRLIDLKFRNIDFEILKTIKKGDV